MMEGASWEPHDDFRIRDVRCGQVVKDVLWDKWDLEHLEELIAIVKRHRRAAEFDFIPGRA